VGKLIVLAALVCLGILGLPLLARRRASRVTHELDGLVMTLLGEEWARRTGTSVRTSGQFLRHPGHGLSPQILAVVKDVQLRFERVRDSSKRVKVQADCRFRDGGKDVTASAEIDWHEVPDTVRADFIRANPPHVQRVWTPGDGRSSAAA
jgi:hypothetical protein